MWGRDTDSAPRVPRLSEASLVPYWFGFAGFSPMLAGLAPPTNLTGMLSECRTCSPFCTGHSRSVDSSLYSNNPSARRLTISNCTSFGGQLPFAVRNAFLMSSQLIFTSSSYFQKWQGGLVSSLISISTGLSYCCSSNFHSYSSLTSGLGASLGF